MNKDNKFIDIFISNIGIEAQMGLVDDLAVNIFGCLVNIDYGYEPNFIPSKKEEACQRFIYEWDVFKKKKIEWDDWSDIAEEGLSLLKDFFNSEIEDYTKLSNYDQFMIKVATRVNELIKSDKYDNEFKEWGKDD
jgi:hypothetical protein